MEVKPGYKQTEVGVIPEEWDIFQLSEHFRIYAGGDVPKYSVSNFRSETHPYPIFANSLQDGGLYGFTNERRAKADSVTVTARGYLGHAEYRNEPFFPIVRLLVLEPSDALDAQFTTFAINERVKFAFESTGVPQLTAPQIGKYSIAAPPLPEQRAIATALSDVDGLLGRLDRLIAKKRDLKQAAMQQLLTGQTRLPGFQGEWVPLNMADNSTLKARIGWQGLTTAEYLKTGDYFLVTGTDFSDGRIAWSSCCFVAAARYTQDQNIQLQSKDILLTKDGTIGKVAYVDHLPGPATLNSGVFVIRPKGEAYEPHFFYYILTSRIFEEFLNKLAAGSTISHLYQKDFVTFSFLVPPSLPEQTAIAEVLTEMDTELAALVQRREKICDLKQAMMQELLTGRTRLV